MLKPLQILCRSPTALFQSVFASYIRLNDLVNSIHPYASGGRTEEKPVVALLTVTFKSIPGGNYKQHDNVEVESEFTATYMKLTVGGEDITEIDVLANIYKAGGQDVLASYRANIGA